MEIKFSDLRPSYDLIVIGSGPAGMTLAHKYEERTGNSVLILESGGRSETGSDNARKLSLVDATGDLPATNYAFHNQRVFGGTSIVWNGWCQVLEKRAFLNDEWPFSYDDLYAYYPEAADILDVPEAVHRNPETPFPDNANVVYRPYYFSPPTRFNVAFDEWVSSNANVDVLFNHSVTRINIRGDAASSVAMLESSGSRPVPAEAFGNEIALAAGGVQNARLLQLSLPRHSKLPVGQYFCEHPHLYQYAELVLDELKLQQVKDKHTLRIVHAIALSSEFCNEHSLASATFQVRHTESATHNILGRSRRTIAGRTHVRAEMASLGQNRITLSDNRRDSLNQPVAHVGLKFNLREIRTACDHLNVELVRSGLGRMGIRPEKFNILGGGHMMGSTRMGDDPGNSVADAQGRVHGMENLYVAGSSLFPSAAAANPTLTIVALSLRLADYLSRRQ